METFIVIVIVAAGAGYLWRNVARSVKIGAPCCNCSGCSGCPMARQKQSCGK